MCRRAAITLIIVATILTPISFAEALLVTYDVYMNTLYEQHIRIGDDRDSFTVEEAHHDFPPARGEHAGTIVVDAEFLDGTVFLAGCNPDCHVGDPEATSISINFGHDVFPRGPASGAGSAFLSSSGAGSFINALFHDTSHDFAVSLGFTMFPVFVGALDWPAPDIPTTTGGPGLFLFRAAYFEGRDIIFGTYSMEGPFPPVQQVAHAPTLLLWATSIVALLFYAARRGDRDQEYPHRPTPISPRRRCVTGGAAPSSR